MKPKANETLVILLFIIDIVALNVLILHFSLSNQSLKNIEWLIFMNISWVFSVILLKFYTTLFTFEKISTKTFWLSGNFLFLTILLNFDKQNIFMGFRFQLMFFLSFFFYILFLRFLIIFLNKKFHFLYIKNENVVFIGSDNNFTHSLIQLLKSKNSNYNVKEVYIINHENFNNENLRLSIKSLNDFNGINHVFTTISPSISNQMMSLAHYAEFHGIKFRYYPDIEFSISRNSLLQFEDKYSYITYNKSPLDFFSNRLVKRLLDLILSLLFLIFISPWLFLIIGLIIKLTSKGPIFFNQKRTGQAGKVFNCLKFRTMFLDIDFKQTHTNTNGHRITKFGSFLRKSSLDESPQFINVLLGQMSIVGPRPHMLVETEKYNRLIEKYNVRLYPLPGITGLAQINGLRGGNELVAINRRVEKDIEYIQNWNIFMDIRIILRTLFISLGLNSK